ncbi:MAG: cell division protein [Chthonomonadales bacterium]|nr:cell division protein [Chthonomonadales bacterium]
MTTITVETYIQVPVEICFDLARDIGLHCRTAACTQERAVAGVTTGLIGLGEEVTFEAVHFGIRQRLTSLITEFDPPHCFADEMLRGAFKALRHVHEFRSEGSGTVMTDTLTWTAPFGILGKLADTLFLKSHMRHFLRERNANLKQIAEAEQIHL